MIYIVALASIAALVGLDQWTKRLVQMYLAPSGRIPVWDGVFEIIYHTNDGAAFGLLPGKTSFFIVMTAIILIAMTYYFIRMPRTKVYNWVRVMLVIVASGAIGNLIDRTSESKKVIDFLYFSLINFPVFNVADIFVVCGTIGLSIILLFFLPNTDKKSSDSEAVQDSSIQVTEKPEEEKEVENDDSQQLKH